MTETTPSTDIETTAPTPSGSIAAVGSETAGLTLQQKLDYASALADSELLPAAYKGKPANVLVAMEYGGELGIGTLVAVNQITVINGGVSMEAKLMMTLARRAGHIVRLSGDDKQATCIIIRADDPGHESVVTWDEAKAKTAGLWGKGHWAKNPGLMLKYRAASENIRLTCPEVLAGIVYTPEELDERTERAGRSTMRVQQVPSEPEKTAAYFMRTLKLNGGHFKAFAQRVLGHPLKSWESLAQADKQRVLGALASWEKTGADPTTGEVLEAEPVEGGAA
ncbi:RecT-like ssDNA annealing protein [Propionibacterium phage Anatole]|uniref:RecT-like ssDNA binding protein n=2 Tax=Anatolevirus anatole TaxID=2169704 RepID=A0A1D8ETF6_9CAUD|nr:RecT-like ssDNA annealing protein [Propionibacterium phage Anatole]AOT24276.1 RecT-like ssDNA binding protein [Propionibacterium phage Anatole]AOT24512.1 RecT-like ssDNA binding protein [Propionibacterium phage E1]